ncbi:MAG: glutathione S-transferase family protein [Alphaproteobacteria bacterium]
MTIQASLTLYTMSPSRGSIAHWMLEEIGAPYTLNVLDAGKGDTRTPAFLALNPMGKVPTLVHDGVAISEVAAICCYLADAFPAAGLAVPIGDKRRGPYLKWLFFGPSCLEPAVIDKMAQRPPLPRVQAGWADYDTVLGTLEAALKPGPYLTGAQFTAADLVIAASLRWGMFMKAIEARPAFVEFVTRCTSRPAFQRQSEWDRARMAKTAQSPPS